MSAVELVTESADGITGGGAGEDPSFFLQELKLKRHNPQSRYQLFEKFLGNMVIIFK